MRLKHTFLTGFLATGMMLLSTPALAVDNGAKAPGFSLPAQDGKTYKLEDFRGKYVVLEWFNKDCPYVRKHYNSSNMQNLQKQFTQKGVVWFSIVSSAPGKQGYLTAKEAQGVLKKEGASPTALLMDPEGTVGKQFSAKTTPHMYIIDPKGNLVFQGGIDDKPSASPASLKKAVPLFANALTSALNGKPIANAAVEPYGCSVKYK